MASRRRGPLRWRATSPAAEAGVSCSLERDILPRAIDKGSCYGFRVEGPLVDIGTPERYQAAQSLLR